MKKPSLKDRVIQIASDAEEVLKAYEHLAIRVFIFAMAAVLFSREQGPGTTRTPE